MFRSSMFRAVAALAVCVVGLSAAPAVAQKARVLNVYNWSDYVDPQVLQDFTKETGIKLRYDTFDSNDTLEAKLLAGKSGYDIVVPTAYFLERQIKAGLFQKLDKTKLPNLTNVWPQIAQRLATYDPGNDFAVNYMWGTTGIGYNVKKAKEILGGAVPDSWDIVFKPENLAKFKDCGVMMLDSSDDIMPAALHYLGLNPNSTAQADLDKAAELIAQGAPVGAQVSFVGISDRARDRRDLPGGRLVRRHQAGAEARCRGERRCRSRLRHSGIGRADVLRQFRNSEGCKECRRGA